MNRPALSSVVVSSAVTLAAALSFVGCSSPDTPPVADDSEVAKVEAALGTPDGGLGTSDVAPDFGDNDIAQIVGFDDTFADKIDRTQNLPAGARLYKLVLLWGHLPDGHDADDGTIVPQKVDWSGSISVDAGGIGLSKTLRFDDKDEVLARTEAKSLSFASRTYPAVDGMVLRVVVPAASSQTLHFATNALNADIDLSALLRDVGGRVPLGDGRNALYWVGFPDAPGCTNGFVLGHWSKLVPSLGKLRASVYDDTGNRVGRVKGIWGHAKKADKNVFFGKYVTPAGKHAGLLGGTYEAGTFQGLWGNRATNEGGGMRGFYSAGYDKTDTKGVWLGRYAEPCTR